MQILDGIAPLAARYDGYVLDLWGVVHDGRKLYPGTADALGRLKAAGKQVAFLTNAPRRAWFIAEMLDRMGLDRALYDAVVSSGELAWRHLRHRNHAFFDFGRRCVHIGPERDLSVAEDGAAEVVARAEDADFLLNTGPDPARGPHSPEAYRPALEACAARGLPMVCVNPDRWVMVGADRLICAGALADLYLAMGQRVFEVGKPDPAVYGPVLDALGIADRGRVVAIGDSPHTDLAGAQAAGLDAVWALTGLAAHAHGGAPDAAALRAEAEREGVSPVAALRELRW